MAEFIEFINDMLKYILIIGIIILMRVFIISTSEVVGDSMKPTLNNNEFLLVEQLTSRFKKYNRFDIVVMRYESPKYLIKRVIGLPNDNIKYIDNTLYINNEIVEQDFQFIGEIDDFEVNVGENLYFLIGDNRDNSLDSRVFGAVSSNKIVGKPIIALWPLNKIRIIKK